MKQRATRRTVLSALTTAGVLGTASTSVATAQDSTVGGWPMVRHDAANTGYAPDERGPTDGVNERWRVRVGDWALPPVVVDGTVYIGGGDASLVALDATTGERQWRASGSLEPRPAVADGTVVVGTRGGLHALDARDGTEQWADLPHSWFTAPKVVDGTVYAGDNDGFVRAKSLEDGARQWLFEASAEVPAAPAIADGTLYVTTGDGGVYALDVGGAEQWRTGVDSAIQAAPVVANGTVFVTGESRTLYALDTETGSETWRSDAVGGTRGSPAVADSTVYVGTNDGEVFAFDATDGSRRWRTDVGAAIMAPLSVAGGTVYVPNWDGNLYALDAADGTLRWRFQTDYLLDHSPAIADGMAFLAATDGHLYALEEGDRTVGSAGVVVPGVDPVTYGQLNHLWEWEAAAAGAGFGTALAGSVAARRWVRRRGGTRAVTGEALRRVGDALDPGPGDVERPPSDDAGDDAASTAVAEARDDEETGGEQAAESPNRETVEERLEDARAGLDAVADDLDSEPVDALYERLDEVAAALDAVADDVDAFDDLAGRFDDLDADLVASRDAVDRVGDYRDRIADARERLDGADQQVEDDPDAAVAAYEDIAGELDALAEDVGVDELAGVGSEVAELRARCQDGRERAAEQRPGPPLSIPGAPDVEVAYEDLTEREVVGQGGNADVVLMTTPEGEELAVKRPRFSGTLHGETVERFLEEAETWARLDDHDHVVDIIAYDSEPLPWIAMEYMDGGDLGARIADLSFREAVWVAHTVTEAVLHAHRRGVAHLDLKPANILFRTTTGDGWDVPKVADWGLAKLLLEHSKSVEGLTPEYAAPEQVADGYGRADQQTDVYQLGAVFYEVFTGQPPFSGEPFKVIRRITDDEVPPPTSVDPSLPAAVDEILMPALAKEKADRYEDLLYLRDSLRDLSDGW